MRLTLRTLLAYLDDILDPEDAQDLKKKIEESEFAAKLVQRIRNSWKQAGKAPGLDGKGMGLDPNTVAEYLDNTMAPEQVPDFEKVCLESDLFLGEVASSHQILTLVLGEPAEVDHPTRQRMYRIGFEPGTAAPPLQQPPPQQPPVSSSLGDEPALTPLVNEALVSGSAENLAAASQAAAGNGNTGAKAAKPRPKPEVPDYLRENNRIRILPLVVTLTLAFVVVALLLRAMGPFDATHPLAGMLGVHPVEVVQQPETPPKPAIAPPENDPSPEVPDSTDGDESAPLGPENNPPAEPEGEPAEPVVEPMPVDPDPPAGPAGSPPDQVATADPPDPPVEPGVPADAVEPPVEVKKMGLYVNQQLLARHNPADSQWERVEANAPISSGDTLLAFPTYRPDLVLASGLKTTLIGPARMRILPPNAQGTPRISLEYGQTLLLPVGQLESGIDLDLGIRHGTLTFANAGSAAGVEVIRFLPPGANPEETAATMFVQIFVTKGEVQWREGVDPSITIPAGAAAVLRGDEPPVLQTVRNAPEWLANKPLTGIDRTASLEMDSLFSASESPFTVVLKEAAAGHRRSEIKSLAARSLCYLDEVDFLMPLFDDKEQRSNWPDQFNALQAALRRSPAAAAEVREMLVRLRSDDAEQLYRLLWGYSQQQLDEGAAEELVTLLDHESMDFRVLAFENLQRITGSTHLYLPYLSEANRRSKVQKWKERLAEKTIVYKEPPAPIPQREPLGAAAPPPAEIQPVPPVGEAVPPAVDE